MDTTPRIAQYVYRNVNETSKLRLHDLCTVMGLTRDIVENLHTTIMYANKSFMKYPKLDTENTYFSGIVVPTLWDTQDGPLLSLLLKRGSEYFTERHNYMKSLGGLNNFVKYRPHISLTYNIPPGYNNPMLDQEIVMTLGFSGEIYEDVYEKWRPNNSK